ncbi:MAG TPA: YdaS family helix-turn-helix protein [Hyphomicrobiaceae bacterium]|jgi:hypothetical protein|nr:YdaS family helix-turn-helix protein [Hyphomicrobiaceae bacterium]
MPTQSTREAITALGGVVAVAKLCGVGRNAVSNWYRRGFPAETYAILAPRLRKAGCEISPTLFRQYTGAPVAAPLKLKRKARKARRRNGRRQ